MKSKLLLISILQLIYVSAYAAPTSTGKGKVLYTQGHNVPSCRTVLFKENATGQQFHFRIPKVEGGQDDLSAIILAALMGNKDVIFRYDPEQTTGCGTEPRILYVTIHNQ